MLRVDFFSEVSITGIMGMNYPTCFICGKLVLEIQGQDHVFKHYYLRSIDSEDQEALDQGAEGACHLLCMIHSQWGELWSRRTIEHWISVLGHDLVIQNEQMVILIDYDRPVPSRAYDPARYYLHFIRRDGWIGGALTGNLQHRQVVDEGWLLPMQGSFEIDLSDFPELAQNIKQAFKETGEYPLEKFIQAFDVQKYLLYRQR